MSISPESFGHFFESNDEYKHWNSEQKPQEWGNLADNTVPFRHNFSTSLTLFLISNLAFSQTKTDVKNIWTLIMFFDGLPQTTLLPKQCQMCVLLAKKAA